MNENKFSFFKAPIRTLRPTRAINLKDAYNLIVGDEYEIRTIQLRGLSGDEAKEYKINNFDFCTFSGTFDVRKKDGLIKHSNLLCIDFDNIKDLDWLREKLLEDEYFETQLIFKSPSGNGLKWLISIDIEEYDHLTWFNSIEVYIDKMYGIKIDKSGKDVCRSCFLCHDKDAYINEKF